MDLRVRGAISRDDFLRMQRLFMRPRRWAIVLGLVVAALWSVALYSSLSRALERGKGYGAVVGLLVAALYFAAYFLLFLPWWWRRAYAQQKTLHAPFEYRFSGTHFRMESSFGNAELPWDIFRNWRSGKHLILIYQTDKLVHLIPRRLLAASDAEKLEGLLLERLGRAA